MGLILLVFIIALVITVSVFMTQSKDDGIFTAIVCSVIFVLFLGVTWGVSYNSYLKARRFYHGTMEQYVSAINVYESKADIDMQEAFTDSKYQGYQNGMIRLITDLRHRTIKYNNIMVGKRTMGSNWFFSWCIIDLDPNMVIVKLGDYKGGALFRSYKSDLLPPT